MKDYILRKDIVGEVSLGSYEANQPERIHLNQVQPSVRVALERKGLEGDELESALKRFSIYETQFLLKTKKASLSSLKGLGKKKSKKSNKSKDEPKKVPQETPLEVQPKKDLSEPSEGEELTLDGDDENDIPHPSDVNDMERDELESIAERFDLLHEIEGTGSNGYRKVQDLKSFLIPWAEKNHKE